MAIEDDIAFLEQVPFLQQLGTGALRILAIGAESYTVQEGQLLFAAGDLADCAYILQYGSFDLRSDRLPDGAMIAEPGTLLGETALLSETLRPVTATALEDSGVLRVSRAMFVKMLESFPDAAQRLRELIANRAEQWAGDLDNVRAVLARGTGPR
ncbi:MAG TPA: Crp/Fnr family transcriptional regulator [Xanthobacteraceae bacterium]|jgi:CRP-like cAMP-binding protein|nr:Crp/Fnr family transcriptional regulator [Xanthobacteraceae bacterium]